MTLSSKKLPPRARCRSVAYAETGVIPSTTSVLLYTRVMGVRGSLYHSEVRIIRISRQVSSSRRTNQLLLLAFAGVLARFGDKSSLPRPGGSLGALRPCA